MDTDEFLPRRGGLAHGGRRDTVAFQDVPHGLVADTIAQVRQSADDVVIPPRAVLAGHAHHEVFQCLVDAGTSHGGVRLCAVTRPGHKFAVPREDGLGLRYSRDFFQDGLAQLLAKHGEGGAFSIGQGDAALALLAQDTVFRRQVCIT